MSGANFSNSLNVNYSNSMMSLGDWTFTQSTCPEPLDTSNMPSQCESSVPAAQPFVNVSDVDFETLGAPFLNVSTSIMEASGVEWGINVPQVTWGMDAPEGPSFVNASEVTSFANAPEVTWGINASNIPSFTNAPDTPSFANSPQLAPAITAPEITPPITPPQPNAPAPRGSRCGQKRKASPQDGPPAKKHYVPILPKRPEERRVTPALARASSSDRGKGFVSPDQLDPSVVYRYVPDGWFENGRIRDVLPDSVQYARAMRARVAGERAGEVRFGF